MRRSVKVPRAHRKGRQRNIRRVNGRIAADVDAVRIDDEEGMCARLRHRAEELGHLVTRHAVEERTRRCIKVQQFSLPDAEIVPVDDAVRLRRDRCTAIDLRKIP